MHKIKIQTLRYDDENDIKFRISFYNGALISFLDFYGEDIVFKKFAAELIDFPKYNTDVILFEIGEDIPGWAYFLSLKIICVHPNGGSIIRVLVDNHKSIETGYRTEFSINVEIAEINRFGQSLLNWIPEEGNEIVWK